MQNTYTKLQRNTPYLSIVVLPDATHILRSAQFRQSHANAIQFDGIALAADRWRKIDALRARQNVDHLGFAGTIQAEQQNVQFGRTLILAVGSLTLVMIYGMLEVCVMCDVLCLLWFGYAYALVVDVVVPITDEHERKQLPIILLRLCVERNYAETRETT